jgi:hypothetical protein
MQAGERVSKVCWTPRDVPCDVHDGLDDFLGQDRRRRTEAMNSAPFLGRVSSLPALVALAFSGMLLLSLTLWYWMAWTPIPRYYLGAYFESTLAANDPAWKIDLRRLYKTVPHRNRELAGEDDVVAESSRRDRQIPMSFRHPPVSRAGAAWYADRENPSMRPHSSRTLRSSSLTQKAFR